MHRLAGDGAGRRDAAHRRLPLQLAVQHEQGDGQGALRRRRCQPLRHPQGGAGPQPLGRREAELPEEPAAGHLPAHGQQAGHEALRQQEGAHEGAHPPEGRRSLGHPPLLQLQVSRQLVMARALSMCVDRLPSRQ